MSLSLRYAARSHVGLIRDGNEDSGYASSRLLVIADGMGGQAAGEIASAVAVQTLAELDSPHTTGLTGDPVRDLDERVKLANNKIRAIITQNPELEGMGTTVTALFLAGGSHFAFGHIGDSRAYRLRGGALEQISTDHTWVQRLIDEGQITEEEATRHPQRSLLMRALGTTPEVDLDLTVLDAQAGDRYLLCSDGLSGFVPFNTLASTLTGYGDPHHAAETLIQHALRGGGADNITCIVADVYEQGPGGGRTASQAETQYLELPVIVGAAAEEQANANATSLAGTVNPQQPGPGDPNVTGVFPAAAAEQGAPAAAVDGREDTAELEAVEAEEPARRRWVKPAAIAGACVVVLGGLGAAAYLWTQQQYYVGADSDGHVAIYQGVDYSLAGITLSHVYSDETVTVAGLPSSQQSRVRSSITTDGLSDARSIVSTLSVLESECAAFTAAQSAPALPTTPTETTSPPAAGSTDASSPSSKVSDSPTGRASDTASPHSSGAGTDTATKSPTATPTPSVAPSSSVSSGNAELQQLSAQCPADAG